MTKAATAKTIGRLAGVVAVALGASACADLQPAGPAGVGPYGYAPPPRPVGPPPPVSQPAFDAQAFAWSTIPGPGRLSGRVAYRAQSGERWTCSGQTIALIPATRYSALRMQVLYGSTGRAIAPAAEVRERNAANPGVDYGRFVRTAACDRHDGFSFSGLAPGPYFLIARARPRGAAPGPNEGVVVMRQIDVAAGPQRLVVPEG